MDTDSLPNYKEDNTQKWVRGRTPHRHSGKRYDGGRGVSPEWQLENRIVRAEQRRLYCNHEVDEYVKEVRPDVELHGSIKTTKPTVNVSKYFK